MDKGQEVETTGQHERNNPLVESAPRFRINYPDLNHGEPHGTVDTLPINALRPQTVDLHPGDRDLFIVFLSATSNQNRPFPLSSTPVFAPLIVLRSMCFKLIFNCPHHGAHGLYIIGTSSSSAERSVIITNNKPVHSARVNGMLAV